MGGCVSPDRELPSDADGALPDAGGASRGASAAFCFRALFGAALLELFLFLLGKRRARTLPFGGGGRVSCLGHIVAHPELAERRRRLRRARASRRLNAPPAPASNAATRLLSFSPRRLRETFARVSEAPSSFVGDRHFFVTDVERHQGEFPDDASRFVERRPFRRERHAAHARVAARQRRVRAGEERPLVCFGRAHENKRRRDDGRFPNGIDVKQRSNVPFEALLRSRDARCFPRI